MVYNVLMTERLFEIKREISVKTYDIDFAGHVSNIVYLRWMEDLRLAIFDEYFPLAGLMQDGYLPIITESRIQYKKAVDLFDKPVGHMWIARMKAASFDFEGEILVDGEVTTRAYHTGVFISSKTMRPVRVPQIIKDKAKPSHSCR